MQSLFIYSGHRSFVRDVCQILLSPSVANLWCSFLMCRRFYFDEVYLNILKFLTFCALSKKFLIAKLSCILTFSRSFIVWVVLLALWCHVLILGVEWCGRQLATVLPCGCLSFSSTVYRQDPPFPFNILVFFENWFHVFKSVGLFKASIPSMYLPVIMSKSYYLPKIILLTLSFAFLYKLCMNFYQNKKGWNGYCTDPVDELGRTNVFAVSILPVYKRDASLHALGLLSLVFSVVFFVVVVNI